METRTFRDVLIILNLASLVVTDVLTDSIKLEDTIGINSTPEHVTEKNNTTHIPCTMLQNQRQDDDTYNGLGSMVYYKLRATLNLQNILCNVLSVYNNLVNQYVTRATSLSKRMEAAKNSVELMLNELDDIIDNLHEYNTDSQNQKEINDLIMKALVTRESLQVKFESEYNILQCGSVMGKKCEGDNDCRGVGCYLQCKTSGYLWWVRNICSWLTTKSKGLCNIDTLCKTEKFSF